MKITKPSKHTQSIPQPKAHQLSQQGIQNQSQPSNRFYLYYDRQLNLLWNKIPTIFYKIKLENKEQKEKHIWSHYQQFHENGDKGVNQRHGQQQDQCVAGLWELGRVDSNWQLELAKYMYYGKYSNEQLDIHIYQLIPIHTQKQIKKKIINKNWGLSRNMLRASIRNSIHLTFAKNLLPSLNPLLNIQLLTCSALYLSHSSISLQQIRLSSIMFPYLQQLDLSNNKIESIEALVYLHAPYLETVRLNDNFIIGVKGIAKANWYKGIRHLYLNNNFIIDFKDGYNRDYFCKAMFHNLEVIKLQLFGTSSVNGGMCLSWLFKCDLGNRYHTQIEEQISSKNNRQKNMAERVAFLQTKKYPEQPSDTPRELKLLNLESNQRIGRYNILINKKLKQKYKINYNKIKMKANFKVKQIFNNANPYQI